MAVDALLAAHHAAQHAAQDLAAQVVADGAGGGFDEGLHQPVVFAAARAGGAKEQVARHAHQAAAGLAVCCAACRCCRLACAGLEHFVGGFAVYGFFVVAGDQGVLQQRLAFGFGGGADAAGGRDDEGALGDAGAAFFIEQADERFAYGQAGDGAFHVKRGVGAHGLRGGLDGFLVARGEGAQGVLHAVAQLGEHGVGHVHRVLGDEVHAHAFAAHQAHDEFYALQQGFGRVGKEQVGFVEEEDHLWLFGVAYFGQALEQLGEQPQQEGGVQARGLHEFVGDEDVDDALAAFCGLHHVVDVEHGFAEEAVAALAFDLEQRALDGADAGAADVAVGGGELFGVVAHVLEHGAQVFGVEQEQAAVVGNLEDDAQHARLRVVQAQHAAQQQRPHV